MPFCLWWQGISQFETHFEHFHFYAKKNKLINDWSRHLMFHFAFSLEKYIINDIAFKTVKNVETARHHFIKINTVANSKDAALQHLRMLSTE